MRAVALGIETSGGGGSVALSIDGEMTAETLDRSGGRHARELIPAMKRLLDAAGLTPRTVDVIGVSVGPGSFTGLRVGVAAAKTFAWATGAKVVGVPTHAVVRETVGGGGRLVVVSNAERGQLFATVFGDGEPRTAIRTPDELIDRASGHPVVGQVPKRLLAAVAGLNWLGEGPGDPRYAPAAATVASIAATRFEDGGPFEDPYALLPDYGRLSAAEEAKRAAG